MREILMKAAKRQNISVAEFIRRAIREALPLVEKELCASQS
jgi:predicted HicB family RNase H-like nuclease